MAARASSNDSGKGKAVASCVFTGDSPPPPVLVRAPPLRLSVLLLPPLEANPPRVGDDRPPLRASTDDGGRRFPAFSPSKVSSV